jgi:hypothetical protein
MPSRISRLLGVFPSLPEANGGKCAADPQVVGSAIGRSLVRYVRLRRKTDEDLVADLLANEPDALTILFERHSALVFRIGRRILRNDAEAEDAVQQVFLDMFRAAEQFEPEKGALLGVHGLLRPKKGLTPPTLSETPDFVNHRDMFTGVMWDTNRVSV